MEWKLNTIQWNINIIHISSLPGFTPSFTLRRCKCRLTGTNASRLCAFSLLGLKELPEINNSIAFSLTCFIEFPNENGF
jgi:hypothetical protein